jgi:ubiquinone/menaquinone biosynthesis C-methylase UbiE
MVWVIVGVIVIVVGALWGTRPLKIPREPEREGPEVGDAVTAYDRTSRWPIFTLERRVMMNALRYENHQGTLVDIGCGPGNLAAKISRRYPALKVTGLDISGEMIDIAQHNWPMAQYNVEFVIGDAHHLPFTDGSFDVVVSSLSMHHWADAGAVFIEIKRILKPGGRFVIMDLRRDGWRAFFYVFKIGQAVIAPKAIRDTNGAVGSFWSAYTPEELRVMLDGAGLVNVELTSTFGWMVARGTKAD